MIDTIVNITVSSLRTFLFSVSTAINLRRIRYKIYEKLIAIISMIAANTSLPIIIPVKLLFTVSSDPIKKLRLIKMKIHIATTRAKYKNVMKFLIIKYRIFTNYNFKNLINFHHKQP